LRPQSKQYLTLHTIENAHPSDIFALSATKTQLLSASGSCSIRIYDTSNAEFPLVQTLENAHPLGVHHLVTAKETQKAASVGFEGKVKIWKTESDNGTWKLDGEIVGVYASRRSSCY
jgi:superkiller protein 8